MVPTCYLISQSSSSFSISLRIIPSPPISISITVTSMFRSFFNYLGRYIYLSICWLFFQFYSVVFRDGKIQNSAGSIFVDYQNVWLSLAIRLNQKFKNYLVSLFLQDGFLVVHIPFFGWANLNSFDNSHWVTFPTQPYLVLYTFCINLLHSLL